MVEPVQSTADLKELIPEGAGHVPTPPGLPEIPGGWTIRSFVIGDRTFSLTLPASPDAFLDDPDVRAAHERTEYMPYWAYLWPASLKMAAAVLTASWPIGEPVLELGCGVGLVGLAAGSCGHSVVFSDYDATAVRLCLYNARQQGFERVDGWVADWQQPSDRQFQRILGCELLYEDRNHDLLIPLLQRTLTPDGLAWFGDGGRVRAARFLQLLNSAGFSYRLLDEQGVPLTEPRVGRYQLVEVRWAK